MRLGDISNILRRDDVKGYLEESWAVGWPMVLIMFFVFLISLTDVYIAGRIGKEVQAAYGFVVQLYFVFAVVATAINVGAVSVISKLYTGDDCREYVRAVSSSIITAGAGGLIFTIVASLAAPWVMGMLDIPEAVKAYGIPLLQIYAVGLIFEFVLINSNGILRSSKRIKVSLITMGIVCVLNIGLNFLLVFATPLGFRGIAVATVISLLVGALINSCFVVKLIGGMWSYSYALVKRIFGVGWPIGLLQIIWQLSSAVIYLILGSLPAHRVEGMAAFTNGLRVESAIYLPAFAFNFANAVVVGNLMGAKRNEDAFRNGLITAGIGICVVSALTLIIVLNASWIMPALSDNPFVIAESKRYLYINMIAEPFMALSLILSGGINGAGDTRSVMIRVAISLWLVRIPLALLFVVVFGWGIVSVWWVMTVSMVIQALLIFKRYWSRTWLT